MIFALPQLHLNRVPFIFNIHIGLIANGAFDFHKARCCVTQSHWQDIGPQQGIYDTGFATAGATKEHHFQVGAREDF